MVEQMKELLEYAEGVAEERIEIDDYKYVIHSVMPRLCAAVREQDKRARHAEAERDNINELCDELLEIEGKSKRRIAALEAENAELHSVLTARAK